MEPNTKMKRNERNTKKFNMNKVSYNTTTTNIPKINNKESQIEKCEPKGKIPFQTKHQEVNSNKKANTDNSETKQSCRDFATSTKSKPKLNITGKECPKDK